MTGTRLIPLFIVIPLAAAFVTPVFGRRFGKLPDMLGNATMACLVALAVHAAATAGTEPLICHMGGWPSRLGIDLRLDPLSALMLLTVSVVGTAATVYSVPYMEKYTAKGRYYGLFLLMVTGMNGVILAGDLFNLYVFTEIAAIASYALVGFGCDREELEASFKYLVLGSVASAFILLGIGLVYGMTGTLNMARAAAALQGGGASGRPVLLAGALFLSGFGLKAALVPFHAWLPDAHPSAPAPISAMLSGVVIKALGVYALARITFNVFGAPPDFLGVLRLLGALSMVLGVLLAIGQWDMKRLLAYHSISQIGYVVLGLGLGTPLGVAGGLFHLVNHSVFKSLLFLDAGAVETATGTRDLKRLGGLARSMPVTAGTTTVASMSIAGIPPFNGFWSKLIIVWACAAAGHPVLAAWAVFAGLMTLASFLKVLRYGFADRAGAAVRSAAPTPALMALPMLALAALCLLLSLAVIGGLGTPRVVSPAAEVLLGGAFP